MRLTMMRHVFTLIAFCSVSLLPAEAVDSTSRGANPVGSPSADSALSPLRDSATARIPLRTESSALPWSRTADTSVIPRGTPAIGADSDAYVNLSLEEAADRLLENNPEVNKARLEWLASQDKYIGSFGAFEPALVGNIKSESTDRPSALLPQSQNTYTGGIEGLLPTATKYSFNFSLTDIQYRFTDNLTKPSTFAGFSVTQPLLQGLWYGKPILEVKSTRVDKEIALHKYRATLTAKMLELENAYWKLCFAQEKLGFADKSVAIAREIVDDSKLQVRAGKISPLDGVEASAGLATRLANYADAQKELRAAINDLKLLIAGRSFLHDTLIHASTPLTISASDSASDFERDTLSDDIYERQPDYLQKKCELDKERLARDNQANQCLPELNLKGTYGYLVPSATTNSAWERFLDPEYRQRSGTFSAEVELRIPIGFNLKERKLLAAEKRNVQSAEINLQALRTQIENYLAVARKRIADVHRNLRNAKIVVDYRKTLLGAEIMRQKAGKSDYRKIFEIEEDLTKSKQWAMENVIDYKSTKAEVARLTGMTMLDKKLESFKKGKPVLAKKLTTVPEKP
jgi:outer membrane protein TolC